MLSIREYDLDDPEQEIRDLAYWQSRPISERLEGLEMVCHSWQKLSGKEDDRVERLRGPVRIIERE